MMLASLRRCSFAGFLALLLAVVCSIAEASSPVIIGMDGLIANSKSTASGIYNTFTYGNSTLVNGGSAGRYRTFRVREVDPNGGGGVDTSYMLNTNSPVDTFSGDVQTDLDGSYFPILDRALGGSMFNPADYQLEVEF